MHALAGTRSDDADGDQEDVLDTIRDAALEVERPIFFSLLIIISAYIPLFTLERVERRLFTPMAFTVCYALLGSMLLALTLIPVLATYLFRNGAESLGESGAGAGCRSATSESCSAAVRSPWPVVAIAGAASCWRVRAWRRSLGSEFLPQLDEGVIWVRANFPAGISLEKSAEMATRDPRASFSSIRK